METMTTQMPEKLKIRLQKRDVMGAKAGCRFCPLAQAINRTLGLKHESRGMDIGMDIIEGAFVEYGRVAVYRGGEEVATYGMPVSAKKFMRQFDARTPTDTHKRSLPYDLKFTFPRQTH